MAVVRFFRLELAVKRRNAQNFHARQHQRVENVRNSQVLDFQASNIEFVVPLEGAEQIEQLGNRLDVQNIEGCAFDDVVPIVNLVLVLREDSELRRSNVLKAKCQLGRNDVVELLGTLSNLRHLAEPYFSEIEPLRRPLRILAPIKAFKLRLDLDLAREQNEQLFNSAVAEHQHVSQINRILHLAILHELVSLSSGLDCNFVFEAFSMKRQFVKG